jgi:hypothetical protein
MLRRFTGLRKSGELRRENGYWQLKCLQEVKYVEIILKLPLIGFGLIALTFLLWLLNPLLILREGTLMQVTFSLS